MIDLEITSTVAAAGGQHAQAKHTIGPLMAFNVGLYLVFAYTMLEAGDVQVVGTPGPDRRRRLGPRRSALAAVGRTNPRRPGLAELPRRVHDVTVNFVITFTPSSIIVLFIGVEPWNPGESCCTRIC